MYDLPNNITRFYQLFDYANYATSNWFGISIVVLIFIVLFFALKNYDTPRAFAAASVTTAVLGLFLGAMGLISDLVLIILIIMASVSIVYLFRAS